MSESGLKLIFGAFTLTPDEKTDEVAHVVETLGLLKELGIKYLDTAQIYGRSEEGIGRGGAAKDFVIDTKIGGGFKPGASTKEGVLEHGNSALERTGAKQFDVYYIHSPDKSVPIEETLESINQLYKDGVFKRFGLSNFNAEQIRQVYNISKEKGYVLPTVYQGNYNAVARKTETEIFPVLRELGLVFYAYSPIAGGFLAKSRKQFESAAGRWEKGSYIGNIYRGLYGKESIVSALDKWGSLAEKEGISRAELAYRWIAHHSSLSAKYGDGIIFGATRDDQIRQTVASLRKGPLGSETVAAIDELWESVKDEAPLDNFNSYVG